MRRIITHGIGVTLKSGWWLAGLLALSTLVYGQRPIFMQRNMRLTTLAPEGVVLADFNNDGKADIAVSSTDSNNVTVLINQGDGSLRAPVPYPVGQKPAGLVAEDLNGDTNLDLIVANQDSGDVSVLLGVGDGTFRAAVSYPTDRGARALVVKDFNNDQIPDLAVANNLGSTVTILLGNGNGTFRPGARLAMQHPYGITAGDYNRDGKMDLAVASYDTDRIVLFLGRGDGTFDDPAFINGGGTPMALVTADFNRDGNPDLAVADNGDEGVAILLGRGDGTFAPLVQYDTGANPVYLAVGDFNLDDIPDLVVSNAGEQTVSVLPGLGNGTFSKGEDFNVGEGPASVAVGDFFNNGAGLDFVAVTNRDNGLEIFTNSNRNFPCDNGTIHFAQFANGNGISSTLTLVNPSTTATARGEIEMFDNQGSGLALSLNREPFGSRKRFAIPPQGAQSFATNGLGPVLGGTLRVCTRDSLGGVVLFRAPGLGTTGVGQSTPLSGFLSPVERNVALGLDTGVAVSNVSGATVTLSLTLRNLNGSPAATAARTLGPNGHLAEFITDLFGSALSDRFLGTIEVKATGGLMAGTALRIGGGQFTTWPVTPLP